MTDRFEVPEDAVRMAGMCSPRYRVCAAVDVPRLCLLEVQRFSEHLAYTVAPDKPEIAMAIRTAYLDYMERFRFPEAAPEPTDWVELPCRLCGKPSGAKASPTGLRDAGIAAGNVSALCLSCTGSEAPAKECVHDWMRMGAERKYQCMKCDLVLREDAVLDVAAARPEAYRPCVAKGCVNKCEEGYFACSTHLDLADAEPSCTACTCHRCADKDAFVKALAERQLELPRECTCSEGSECTVTRMQAAARKVVG